MPFSTIHTCMGVGPSVGKREATGGHVLKNHASASLTTVTHQQFFGKGCSLEIIHPICQGLPALRLCGLPQLL